MRPESPLERLRIAALAYADASDSDEEEYERAEDNLRKSAKCFVESLPSFAAIRKARKSGAGRGSCRT